MDAAPPGMTLACVVGVLVVHNLVTNLWAPARRWYVVANLATAVLLVVVAGVAVPAGGDLTVGVGAALVVLAALGVLAAHRRTRPVLADQRMAGVDARGTAWRALVRIPFGTVVLEEVAFRAVLPALTSPLAAAVLFGLWHVVPTVQALDANGVARTARSRAVAVVGAVVATTIVGLVLWELRVVAGGLLAPALVHTAANSGATVAAHAVLGQRERETTRRGL